MEADSDNVFFRCVESSNDAIMISDLKGKLTYVNPAWVKIYGYTYNEAIGATPKLLHSGFHSDEFYREMWTAIGDPTIGSWKGELINRTQDGRIIPVLLSITPFKTKKGDLAGYMGIAVDLSYRKEMEAKIAQQDRLASIGLLASGLAHEIGTPLGVIRGRAEFLTMQADNPAVQKYMEVIVNQIDRISKLIRSLLRISRSQGDVRIEAVSISAVIEEVLSLVGGKVKSDGIEIVVNIPTSLQVSADYNHLEQVLLNLVMNAAQAIHKAIKDGRAASHQITIQVTQRSKKIALLIQDTGCGIPPENMKKLFKPFFTTKAVGEGTGLGLAIVSQLLHEMGGEIYTESTVGMGTVFTVLLNPVKN